MSFVEKIRAKVIEEGECWLWQGMYRSHAPSIWTGERYESVRRVLMTELERIRPGAKFFAVSCNEPLCVCPDHIIQRTPAQQIAFISALGCTGTAHRIRTLKTAEKARARVGKITMDQAREIRGDGGTLKELAAKYGLAEETVRRIRIGRNWKDQANPFAGL